MKRPFLLPLAAALVAALAAQDPAPAPASPKPAARPSWPKLKPLDADRVEQLLDNFKKNNPELHARSLAELVALGPGAAPILIARLSDKSANDWLLRALERITTAEHAPLIAGEAGAKIVARRRWCTGRLVELAAGEAAFYHKALADSDAEVAYRAAVGLASLGDPAGMDRVFARVKDDWKGCREWLEAALVRGRGTALSAWVTEKAGGSEFADKVAALRLFRSVGAREHAASIAVALDSSDHNIKKEAINALRVVVLGEPALDDLSVFQAIEMAKELKAKL